MCYMFLTDVIHAVHCGATPIYSTRELCIKMPSSNYSFRTLYNALTHGYSALPQDVRSREDSLLLLTALLNDIIFVQRTYYTAGTFREHYVDLNGFSRYGDAEQHNPHAPLSSRSELSRLSVDLHAALDRWENHFQKQIQKDLLALFYFTKLCLTCPEIWDLPVFARYGTTSDPNIRQPQFNPERRLPDIPDKAMDLAWLVLDKCDIGTEPPERKLAVWLPVILFISALVIWQRLRFRSPTDFRYGTLKVLSMFKGEIMQLPWPCCAEMSSTLDRLMNE